MEYLHSCLLPVIVDCILLFTQHPKNCVESKCSNFSLIFILKFFFYQFHKFLGRNFQRAIAMCVSEVKCQRRIHACQVLIDNTLCQLIFIPLWHHFLEADSGLLELILGLKLDGHGRVGALQVLVHHAWRCRRDPCRLHCLSTVSTDSQERRTSTWINLWKDEFQTHNHCFWWYCYCQPIDAQFIVLERPYKGILNNKVMKECPCTLVHIGAFCRLVPVHCTVVGAAA